MIRQCSARNLKKKEGSRMGEGRGISGRRGREATAYAMAYGISPSGQGL